MFKDSSPFAKIILLAFIVLVSTLVFMIIGAVGALLFFKINLLSNPGIASSALLNNISFMKYYQIIESIGMFVVPPLIFARLSGSNIADYLKAGKFPQTRSVFLVLILLMVALPLINFFTDINSTLKLPQFLEPVEKWMKETEDYAGRITEDFLNVRSIGGLMVNLLMIAVIPAVGEEFLFRGILQRLFSEWTRNKHIGILIAAVLFSAFHLQFYGFLPRMMLGLLFGYLFIWSESIWLPVAAHFFNNSFAVLSWFIANKEVNDKIDKLGSATGNVSDIVMLVLSAVFTTLIIFLVFRKEKRVL
ncbi:MAG: CPBP family intramembrane metalloprotease [Bacteroidia bacterium]|nr:CPBP family intramembrane metalloprotease [Bacteroidia bacterium]